MPTLDWIGKQAVVKHHKDVPYRLLEPVPELSRGDNNGGDDNGNLIVQGDNLHALKALLPRYAGQVKCIYIDPPYNTGNEGWVYNDNVNSPEIRKWLNETVGKEGEDLSRHDKWLCMMYPRLVLLKHFLREDGAIFVSVDDSEVAALRLLLDEIFGRTKFVATFVWQKRYSRENRETIGDAHEYILCYTRNIEQFKQNRGRVDIGDKQKALYKNPDNDSRGSWQSVSMTAQGYRPNQMYEIQAPNGKIHTPPEGRCWSTIEEEFRKLKEKNRIYWGRDGNGVPRIKRFLSDDEGLIPWSWLPHDEVGHTGEAKIEIRDLFGTQTAFDTPKPTRLLGRILQIATPNNSIVLDSFAGSGTTAHAVLKQNAADGGNRKFILVEMEEDIARNVTAERVRRVTQGYTNSKGNEVEGLGGGFQYCKLSEQPLFDATGAVREDVDFAQLAEFVWFAETGAGFAGDTDSPLIGVDAENRGIYLLYNGILKDRSVNGGNVLTAPVLAQLPPHNGPKVIYAAACRLGRHRLEKAGITLKQTPYALEV